MIGLVLGLQEKVRREYGLGGYNTAFYRDCPGRCSPCKRYFELLDACPLRIPFTDAVSGDSP